MSIPLRREAIWMWMAGGWCMWPILAVHLLTAALALERLVFLLRARAGTGAVAAEVVRFIEGTGDAALALGAVREIRRSPMGRVASAGLMRAGAALEEADVALEVVRGEELAWARRRTAWLKTLIDVSVLLGILGALTGMVTSFCIPSDPVSRAMQLAHGLSESMTCIAFGLIGAVAGLALRASVLAQTDAFATELDAGVMAIRNALHAVRGLRFDDVRRVPITSTYRD